MPGKQMSIDAEMQNGVITEAQAIQKEKNYKKKLISTVQWMVPGSLEETQ